VPTGWRIVKSRYAEAAFDGEGARLYGGRWNSPGTRMVYTAQSKSLAILEVLVHIQKVGVLSSYSLIAARFDEDLVERLDPSRLPERWRDYPAPAGLRAIGDAWIESRTSAVLEVPSTIVEGESSYLMNPDHPDFASVAVGHPEPFEFDPRLLG
jgi:RES domain-containing protein